MATNGAGLGASRRTGWTGLVAPLIQLFGLMDAKTALDVGKVVVKRRAPAKKKGRSGTRGGSDWSSGLQELRVWLQNVVFRQVLSLMQEQEPHRDALRDKKRARPRPFFCTV